jgi:transposase
MATKEISTSEAAAILGISHTRIHQLAKQGKIEGTYHQRNNGKRGRWTLSRASVIDRRDRMAEAVASSGADSSHMPVGPEGSMTTRQVAEHFGVATETVRSWVRRGHITPTGSIVQRFGREAIVFDRAVVEAFVPPSIANPNWRNGFVPGKGIIKDTEQTAIEQPVDEQKQIDETVASTLSRQESDIRHLEAQIAELRDQMTATNQSNMDLLSSKIDQIVEAITRPY